MWHGARYNVGRKSREGMVLTCWSSVLTFGFRSFCLEFVEICGHPCICLHVFTVRITLLLLLLTYPCTCACRSSPLRRFSIPFETLVAIHEIPSTSRVNIKAPVSQHDLRTCAAEAHGPCSSSVCTQHHYSSLASAQPARDSVITC